SRGDVTGLDPRPAAIYRPHREEERKPLFCGETDQLLGQMADREWIPENKIKATGNAQSEGQADWVRQPARFRKGFPAAHFGLIRKAENRERQRQEGEQCHPCIFGKEKRQRTMLRRVIKGKSLLKMHASQTKMSEVEQAITHGSMTGHHASCIILPFGQ